MKAMLFDMDGVLVDSEPIHFAARARTLRRYGIETDDEELSHYTGTLTETFLREVSKSHGVDIPIEEASEFAPEDFNTELNRCEVQPIEGIQTLLEHLYSKNIPMAVASSSTPEVIREFVKRLGFEKYFRALISGKDVAHSKPAPDVYLKAAEAVGVASNECVVLEDGRNGVLAAKAAGMYCIGFRSPHSGIQDLSKADIIVDKISELVTKY